MTVCKHHQNAVSAPRPEDDLSAAAADRRAAEWKSFWDISSPYDAALALLELFGSNAVRAANSCNASAAADNRHVDQHFWVTVEGVLRVIRPPPCVRSGRGRTRASDGHRTGRLSNVARPPPSPQTLAPRPGSAPHRGKSMI